MAFKVVMPKLSDTMEEGKILKWVKQEGDPVEGGDILAVIETDKADVEMEAFGAGVLRKILAGEGEKCPVGQLIALIADPEEDLSPFLTDGQEKVEEVRPPEAPPPEKERIEPLLEQQPPAEEKPPAEKPAEKEERPPAEEKPPAEKREERPPAEEKPPAEKEARPLAEEEEVIKASPLARRLAKEAGIDLTQLQGTGPGGRITQRDVELFQEQRQERPPAPVRPPAEVAPPAAPPVEYEERELSPMRKAIARRMVQSKAPVPHFYLTRSIDMDRARQMREELNRALGPEARVGFTDMIVKAAALALSRHPQVNSSFVEDRIRTYRRIHIGVAVALEEGLVSAVVRDCDRKGLARIAQEVKDLAERARSRRLKLEELSGSTFTVSNLGMYEVEEFSAIITPPEGAILAVGAILPQPVIQAGEVEVAHRMRVTLSCDHRIIDGAEGARFLQELKRILENPILLMG